MGAKKEADLVGPVAELFERGAFADCLAAARAATPDVRDPMNCGWLIFFEFKALYEMRRYQEAFATFKAAIKPKEALLFSINNAIWMHSVAMEVAFHLKDKTALMEVWARAPEVTKTQPERLRMMETNLKIFLEELG